MEGLLDRATVPVSTVLELGSGGGHNACHLKERFAMTLVDLSDQMIAVSRTLNPECEHLQGDMRDIRLGRTFDAVVIHDAIDYMTTPADLRAAIETAFVHCRPGGVAVFAPDHTIEMFTPTSETGGSDAPDGRGARYLEWTPEPGPEASTVTTQYAFVLRDADGSVTVAHETHVFGLFSREVWLDVLTDVGFSPTAVTEPPDAEHAPREFFVGHMPPDNPS